ncbi:hypothetical protein ABWJ92_19990 [Streptomyces sp. NPDC000609]|uniref:hypothetical protein n=1 Tax=Streptomyces sp. NPDC000609 TaxID=3160957 RepID=UPI00339B5038
MGSAGSGGHPTAQTEGIEAGPAVADVQGPPDEVRGHLGDDIHAALLLAGERAPGAADSLGA